VTNRSRPRVRCRAKVVLRASAAVIHECSAPAGNASSHSKTSPNTGHNRHNTTSAIARATASPSAAANEGARDSTASGQATSRNTTAVWTASAIRWGGPRRITVRVNEGSQPKPIAWHTAAIDSEAPSSSNTSE